MGSAPEKDWAGILQRLTEGDQLAFLQFSRLITGFLARWNAFDFHDEWDDLIQEVILAATLAAREGRFRTPAAIAGWVRSTTRFKFVDRLRAHLRCREEEALPWEDTIGWLEKQAAPVGLSEEIRRDLREALARIPEKKRESVLAVYLEGKTYEEAAHDTGIPMGTLNRYLRDGLAQLREELGDFFGSG
jgi:RNA polymerase sigma-70 factor (ECF subfamily)